MLICLFFLYKSAKKNQKQIRDKARRHFEDMKLAIDYWVKDKSNPERKMLAKISQGMYDDYYKKAVLMPISKYGAEDFEYYDEWAIIFNELDDHRKLLIDNPAKADMVLEFKSALSELRSIELED